MAAGHRPFIMTWQTELNIAPDTYREFLTSIVAVATSEHVSAAAVNAGGTGHAVGDVITITHASAYHDLRLEVTAESAGVITAVRINTGGAFAERAASAVVGAAAGSGYVVGDILEVQNGAGAGTEKAKFKVATLSGSAVATVTLFETGGAYTTTPTITDAATLGIGPDGFAGDDVCNLDLTMQTIIGTSGIAQSSTDGSGINATFDLTLTATGWEALYSRNEGTLGTAADNADKEVVLQGTVVGADSPIIGFQSYKSADGGQDRWGIACYGMTAFNPGLALTDQPNIGPVPWTLPSTSGAHILVTEEIAEANSWWISVNGRRILGAVRGNISTESDSYHTFYVGLMNQYGTTTTNPYPMLVGASSNEANRRTSDLDSTGLCECHQTGGGLTGPVYYLRKTDLTWRSVVNGVAGATSTFDVMWPMGQLQANADGPNIINKIDNYKRLASDGTITSSVRANVSSKHFPAPGSNDEFVLLPLTVVASGNSGIDNINTHVAGELDGVLWPGGTKADGSSYSPEDFLENSAGVRYRAFPASTESLTSRRYQFMVIRED